MSEIEKEMVNQCNMMGVNPAIVQLSYPSIQVSGRNPAYAEILKVDCCGAVSELSAITQYIHSEILLSGENCEVAKVVLGIAMAEMIHLQMIKDLHVRKMIARIMKDEEYHIFLLQSCQI